MTEALDDLRQTLEAARSRVADCERRMLAASYHQSLLVRSGAELTASQQALHSLDRELAQLRHEEEIAERAVMIGLHTDAKD